MQTASMLRTTTPLSSSRVCCNRTAFQAKLVPAALRRGRATLTRAEADNTGGSITNSGQTKNKDSYEVSTSYLPVRTRAFAYAEYTLVCIPAYVALVHG